MESGLYWRNALGPGIGTHLIDAARTRLLAEAGVTVTDERPTEGAAYARPDSGHGLPVFGLETRLYQVQVVAPDSAARAPDGVFVQRTES